MRRVPSAGRISRAQLFSRWSGCQRQSSMTLRSLYCSDVAAGSTPMDQAKSSTRPNTRRGATKNRAMRAVHRLTGESAPGRVLLMASVSADPLDVQAVTEASARRARANGPVAQGREADRLLRLETFLMLPVTPNEHVLATMGLCRISSVYPRTAWLSLTRRIRCPS